MVWYSHLSQNFPQFIVMHTVKGFGIVNKAEIDVFFGIFVPLYASFFPSLFLSSLLCILLRFPLFYWTFYEMIVTYILCDLHILEFLRFVS